jgi:hypothetical protein
MGTRADFYVGRGKDAEWLGSIAWDGYSIPKDVSVAKTETEYRQAIKDFFAERDDVTLPENGWPWPWKTSNTTDFAYAFDGGNVYASCFGSKWAECPVSDDHEWDEGEPAIFPDMSERKNVQMNAKKGGVFVISGGNHVQ